METEIQRLLDTIAELQEKADVDAIFGKPMTVEEHTIIPVAKVTYGFGLGYGHGVTDETEIETAAAEETAEETVGSSGNAGGGVQARPMAIIKVTPENVLVESIVDEQKLALAGSLLVGWGIFCLAKTLVKIFGRRE